MAKKTARRARKSTSARRSAGRTARKASRKGARKTGRKTPRKSASKSARRPNAAFMRPVTPSPQLADVVGSKPIPRTEVTKRLWAYIRKNRLQDSENRRMIKADAALKDVFGGRSQVNMFEMTKLVNKHLK